MIALRFVRRPLDPHQADVIRRRAWGVSVLLYALGIAATIPLIVLVAQGNAPRMLVHGLAIALIVLICFVPTAIAYARSPMREPRIVFARYDDERVVCEIELIADTTVARLRSAGFAWGISGIVISLIPLAFSSSPKHGFALSVGTVFMLGSLFLKQPTVFFPQPEKFKRQRIALHPAGVIVANPTLSPSLIMTDWAAAPYMGTTRAGVTDLHWEADGEKGISRLLLTDLGLSFVALERIMRYFVANADQRDVLATRDGVAVVRAILRGSAPPRF